MGGQGPGDGGAENTFEGWSDEAWPALRGIDPWNGPQSPVRFLRPIGTGGMGVVFEAVEVGRPGLVAAKLLRRVDEGGREAARNEFRAAALISHPNLVQHYRLHESHGELCVTMERVRGGPIDA